MRNSACIILASGYCTRFASNKLIATLGDKKIIQWVIDATSDIFAERVVITRYEEIEKLCKQQNIKVVLHNEPEKSDTIRLGLNALSMDVDSCMFVQADQPLISQENIKGMLDLFYSSSSNIIRACHNKDFGSPVIFPQSCFRELRNLPRDKSGKVVILNHPELVKYYELSNAYELMDVDTQEDLDKIIPFLQYVL